MTRGVDLTPTDGGNYLCSPEALRDLALRASLLTCVEVDRLVGDDFPFEPSARLRRRVEELVGNLIPSLREHEEGAA